MSLGDHFPDKFKASLVPRKLEVGMVLRLFVTDTNPPKEKRFIIVGKSADGICLATVYINSEINERVNWSQELKDQHLRLEKEGREYLTKSSYVNCSEFTVRTISLIEAAVRARPEAVIGDVSPEDWELIKQKIIDSPTIKGKHKKAYGFYGS